MPVTNNHVVEDYNKEWERLSQLHMRQTTIPPKNDASSYVFIFPLSFVVKKCYDYAPLNTLADAFVPYVSDKVRYSMQFQVIFLPNGYSHREHNDYLTKKAMPHHRPILTWKNAKEWTVETFQNAAISFLSEPFLPEQQSRNSDDMANHQDTSVINSIHINSSIWVIGPFIPTSDDASVLKARKYYRIAAGLTYRSTQSGSFIHYIRALYTDGTSRPSAPWDLNLLSFHQNHASSTDITSINSRRLGVMLMSTIQQLCRSANSSTDLYLQTDLKNRSFARFITIGFWYYFKLDTEGTSPATLPLCSDLQQELPEAFHSLFSSAQLTYVTTKHPFGQTIRLLTMKRVIMEIFPPMFPFQEHPMLTEWLYSVPFPSPPKSVLWNFDNGNRPLLQRMEETVWNNYYKMKDTSDEVEDEDKDLTMTSEDNTDEHRNQGTTITILPDDFSIEPFLSKNEFWMSINFDEYNKRFGMNRPADFGDDCILQYFLPHTVVGAIPTPKAQLVHNSWFYTVFTTLYGAETKFEMSEIRNCLFAFWKRYPLLHDDHESFDMWDQYFQKVSPTNTSSNEYWKEAANRLRHDNENCDEFFIDIFRRMLLHQGFQDDKKSFSIGHVCAHYHSGQSRKHLYQIKFQPKCFPPNPLHSYVYIGKKQGTYYSIHAQDDVDEYTFRKDSFKNELCCVITRNKTTYDSTKNHNSDTSTTNPTVTDEGSNSDNDAGSNNSSNAETMEIENVTASTTGETLAINENNQELTHIRTTIQNEVSHHVSDKIGPVTVSNNNPDALVADNITGTVGNGNSALSATHPPDKQTVTNANTSDKVGQMLIEIVHNQDVAPSVTNPTDKQRESNQDANDKQSEVVDHVSNNMDTLIINDSTLVTTTATESNKNRNLDDKGFVTNQEGHDNHLSNGTDDNLTTNQDSNGNILLHVNDTMAESQVNNRDEQSDSLDSAILRTMGSKRVLTNTDSSNDDATSNEDCESNKASNDSANDDATANEDCESNKASDDSNESDEDSDPNTHPIATEDADCNDNASNPIAEQPHSDDPNQPRRGRPLPTAANRRPLTSEPTATEESSTDSDDNPPIHPGRETKRQRDMRRDREQREQKDREDINRILKNIAERKTARVLARGGTVINSDDDHFRWIKHVRDDLYHLKHNNEHPGYEFPYQYFEIRHCYEAWLFQSCQLNTGRFIFINIEGENKPYGEIVAVKHSKDGWHGEFTAEHNKLRYKMSEGWIDKLFGDHFKNTCIRKQNAWIKVPPGNPKQDGLTMQTSTPVLHQSNTPIKYPQGQLRTCMVGSFASCLYYMATAENKTEMAKYAEGIMRDHGLLSKTEVVFNTFYNIVTENCKDRYELKRNKDFSFEQQEELFDLPTVVVLMGRDKSKNHAITVYKDMIFDTSSEKILSRCRETLDWCSPTGFHRIERAYSFIEKPEDRRKQAKKPRKKRRKKQQCK